MPGGPGDTTASTSSARTESSELVVLSADDGKRVDVVLADSLAQSSRSAIRRAIDAHAVSIDGEVRIRPATKVRTGQTILVEWAAVPCDIPPAEPIPLHVLFEDEHLAVVIKPAGMVVHPSRGHLQGTLVAALSHRFNELSTVGGPTRPGIVHRLDRETSGVMVVAKNNRVHELLADQFKARTVEKRYLAIIHGKPDRDSDWIDRPIGNHPYSREKKSLRAGHASSRDARTFYEVQQRLGNFALVRAMPKTGRTHQIRLHLLSVGCPVLGDKLYGRCTQVTARELTGNAQGDCERVLLDRHALHAQCLSFSHPMTGDAMTFTADLPQDMQSVLDALGCSPDTTSTSN